MVSGRKYLEPDRNCHSNASRISGSHAATQAAMRCRNVAISALKPSAAMTSTLAASMLATVLIPLPDSGGDIQGSVDGPADSPDRWLARWIRQPAPFRLAGVAPPGKRHRRSREEMR